MSPLLVWGLFPRLLGLVFVIAFASLLPQVVALAGCDGVSPCAPLLRQMRRDFPLWRCLLSWPTLLWLRCDDWTLRALPILGMAAGIWAAVGGPIAIVALFVCWACYLSLHPALGLAYPWDCLLLEAGFLALFLPAPLMLPSLDASAEPLPAVAWAYRWLVFRMVLGFGKLKFVGVNRKELGYLKAFFIAVPLPGPLGWWMHHLPGWFMKLSLLVLFLIEVPTPFLVFVPGYPRLVAAALIAGLMIAIQLTGNYGHFNVLMLTLCVPLLDRDATILDQPLDSLLWPPRHLLTHVVVLVLFVGGLLYFPYSSWSALAWPYLPTQRYRAAPVRWLVAFYRFLAPFRILHSYGVFPSISFPAARAVPVIEGTQDGVTWHEYRYRWLMTDATSPPVVVAPHTPRLDHFLFYDASGTDVSNFLGSTFGIGCPHLFSRASGLQRLVQRLLEGSTSVRHLFAHDPFPDAPPTAIRVSLFMLRPTTPAQRRASGAWWTRRYVGPHLLAVGRDASVWNEWLGGPELFHPDELVWKLRSPRLRALFACARRGDDVAAHVGDVGDFWTHFIPASSLEERRDWTTLRTTVERVCAGFTAEQLRGFEIVLGRLTLALFARLEPSFIDRTLPLATVFDVHLLACHVIASGKEAFEDAYAHPAAAVRHANEMTPETGMFLTAVFWFEKMAYHARKFRLLQRYYEPKPSPELSGFIALISFLAGQLETPGEECYPEFVRRLSDGEWVLVEEA